MGVHRAMRGGEERAYYLCKVDRCASIRVDTLDEYVQRLVVAWLARPDVYEALSAATSHNDAHAATARAEAGRLRAELEGWRKDAEARRVTREAYIRMETALLRDINAADERAKDTGIPPILRGMIGPDAAAKWAALGDNVAVKRAIIRAVATITIHPAGRRRDIPVKQRVSFGGPIADRAAIAALATAT